MRLVLNWSLKYALKMIKIEKFMILKFLLFFLNDVNTLCILQHLFVTNNLDICLRDSNLQCFFLYGENFEKLSID